jgi:hypothetical protein
MLMFVAIFFIVLAGLAAANLSTLKDIYPLSYYNTIVLVLSTALSTMLITSELSSGKKCAEESRLSAIKTGLTDTGMNFLQNALIFAIAGTVLAFSVATIANPAFPNLPTQAINIAYVQLGMSGILILIPLASFFI